MRRPHRKGFWRMGVGGRCRAVGTEGSRRRLLPACSPRAPSAASGLPGGIGPARLAWVAIALLAFVWQSLLLQTHLHLPEAGAARLAAATISSVAAPEPNDDHATCPICRDAAHFGTYLSPAGFAVQAMLATAASFGAASFLQWPPRHASPGWYGRAPPRRRAQD